MKEAVTKVIDTLTQEDIHGAFIYIKPLFWASLFCIISSSDAQ